MVRVAAGISASLFLASGSTGLASACGTSYTALVSTTGDAGLQENHIFT